MMTALLIAAGLILGEAGHDTLAGRLDGRDLVVRMDGSGVTCRGFLTESLPGEGRGHLVCSDRRTGSFSYKLDGGKGTAYGRLEGESLVLTFD